MTAEPLGVGVIGCGVISGIYLQNAVRFPNIAFRAVADRDAAAAERRGAEFGLPATSPKALLARDDIDIVLNLTPPAGHAQVSLNAIAAGKHVYSEKPLCVSAADARQVLDAAKAAGLRVGCAPDTSLCAAHQGARAALDAGRIGRPIAGTATLMLPGHEAWHPNPDLYYVAEGGGPLFDMGPYYLTWMIALLGPVARVTGLASKARDSRTIATGPRTGESVTVATPTHIAAALEFAGGATVQLTTSFDVRAHRHPPLEIYGTDGSLTLPDPNRFDGEAEIFTDRWSTLDPGTGPRSGNWRGIGLADMVRAIISGRDHLCHGDLALHVLDVMETTLAAAAGGAALQVKSTVDRPAPVDNMALLEGMT